jgi:16S rRNA C1402 N4-methylase RsmH
MKRRKIELKDVLKLIAELSDRTGELHLISFYSDEDGYVSRDRPRSDEAYDFSKRIAFKFENLADAARKIQEYLADLEN